MTLASIRTTVAGYFGGTPTVVTDSQNRPWTVYRQSPITGVSALFLAKPSEDNELDYFTGLADGTRTGVKLAVRIGRKTSVRRAIGGDHDGIRANVYTVAMQCFGLSISDHAELAQGDFEAVLDALEAFLYADRSLGTIGSSSGDILDGGEGPGGLTIAQDAPVAGESGRIWLYAEVGFNVREWIHG